MRINGDYTFQNYLVGDRNKDVIEAVSSTMTLPGQINNPLFIYGSAGVGKTHLLQALAQEYSPDSKIYYATIEDFVNDIIRAIQRHRYIDFIEHCLDFDVLLIDDIHLVKNKKSTLEELLHIFVCLYNCR
jgi:chromosomal replication initiator protein